MKAFTSAGRNSQCVEGLSCEKKKKNKGGKKSPSEKEVMHLIYLFVIKNN